MRSAILLLVAFAAGCADDGAHFTTRFASDFAPDHRSVSVLGVYKDGRMNSQAWDQILGPQLSPSLGSGRCDSGYSALQGANPSLASAIDDYARADGPSDDLLALLSPAAKGDLIMVITVAGRIPPAASKGSDAGTGGSGPAPSMGGGGRGGMGGRRGGRMGGAASSSTTAPERSTLEISASLYSVRDHRPAGLIAMQYDGTSFDDAVAKFAQKLTTTMPATTCVGWNGDAPIDAQRLRDASE